MIKPHQKRIEYQRRMYAMRQVRDTVGGSDVVKRSNVMYAPMPSAMQRLTMPTAVTSGVASVLTDQLPINTAPWYHVNPAYSAYIHRAKFPDMTAATLRGLVGVATRRDPRISLPSTLEYLDSVSTVNGRSLTELFKNLIGEIFQVGRHALVLDMRKDNTFYIAQYTSESYVNWYEEVIDGVRVQTYAEFEDKYLDGDGEEVTTSLVYQMELAENGKDLVAFSYKYHNGDLVEDGRTELKFQGKSLPFLPVVNVGAEENTPEPDAIPLLGVSDCALDIYRHSADLNQAHFMTCNPTLVFIGVDSDSAPAVVGSTVGICLSSKDSDAKYLTTDTSALAHVKEYMGSVFDESVQYGAQILGPTKRAAESAEALALRQAAGGATLFTVVTNCESGIQDVLNMATKLVGSGQAEFEANKDFAELVLSAQDVTALVSTWMSGGLSKLSLLENLAGAGRTGGRSAEEEMDQIESEGVDVLPPTVPNLAEENSDPPVLKEEDIQDENETAPAG